jgi:hypothetical protein
MRVKHGVDIFGIQPELVLGMLIVDAAFGAYGRDAVLTSVCDGKHSQRSLHYKGMAFDVRTRDVPEDDQDSIVDLIRANLPKDWDIVLETTHLHVEYDRKK